MVDVESKSIPHELPSSHWLKATGQCVLERYLSATMRVAVDSVVPGESCKKYLGTLGMPRAVCRVKSNSADDV